MHKGRNPEIPRTKITSFSTTSTPTLHPRGRAAEFQKLKWLERKENYSVAQYLHKKLLTFSFPIFSLWAGPQTWIPTHMHTRMHAQIYVSHTHRLDVHGKPFLTPPGLGTQLGLWDVSILLPRLCDFVRHTVDWIKMHNLQAENYVLLSSLTEDLAQDTASWIALGDCSEEVRERPGYIGVLSKTKNKNRWSNIKR